MVLKKAARKSSVMNLTRMWRRPTIGSPASRRRPLRPALSSVVPPTLEGV